MIATAQQVRYNIAHDENSNVPSVMTAPSALNAGDRITESRFHSTAKATATPFFTETFGSGTRTTLPTGWTATTGAGLLATWHWTNTAATGSFNIGALSSSTKSDGWMIYDSDSIGDLTPTVLPITGALISPTINCGSHTSVLVTFQQLFRKFRDSTYLDVSNDGGVNWTTFPVLDNNSMGDNTTNPNNPTLVRINVSSVAANHTNVKIRFRYVINVNSNVGGTFNWLVDDIAISELDPVEMGIANSGMFLFLGGNFDYSNYSLFSNYPLQLVDSMFPLTFITNYGLNSSANLVANATIYNGNTSVYNHNATFTGSIPTGGTDSLLAWDDVAMFKPTSTGSYTAAFSINPTNDAFAANNIDTARFNITDTVLTTYGNTISGGYYLHRPAASGELSYYMGVRFDIPQGKSDTLTSVSVSYQSGTTAGVNTVVQLYKVTGSGAALSWTPVATMRQKTLTAADISTSTTRVYTTYMANTTAGVAPFILTGGTYAAVATTVNAPSTASVTVSAATPINRLVRPAGYFGQADSSLNTANYEFGADPSTGVATGLTSVPLFRVNFANKITQSGSVGSIAGVQIGDAYPNPANTMLNIPVSTSTSARVSVNLYNMMGQVVMSQDLGTMSANQKKVAVLNTSNLAAGTYIYGIEANGERVTNNIVIAH